ncbi:hypothetical protein CM49_05041 [Paenibacillus sp. P1XP2]|nr:hypothetical protein CM49_05041 [Paenibacillus sp. P1XP2]
MLKLKSWAIAALSASLVLGPFTAPLFSPRAYAAVSGTETPGPVEAPPQEGWPEGEVPPAAQEPPGEQPPGAEPEQPGENPSPADVQAQPGTDGQAPPEVRPGEEAMAPGSGDAAVPGANLALNKPVTASSALPQHPGAYLTDGRLDLMWSTSDTGWQSSPLADEWAMVDLGAFNRSCAGRSITARREHGRRRISNWNTARGMQAAPGKRRIRWSATWMP